MKTPILLLWFNRPDLSREQIESLKNFEHEIYIAIDGPRAHRPNDVEKVNQCRAIARSAVPSERLLIREENLGCGRAVDSAITWFFEHVEQGIILEDDIFPSHDFFSFTEELLNRYAEDERIMCISGDASPLTAEADFNGYSYTFSRFPLIWGWATWRRAWKKYDRNLKSWPELKRRGDLIGLFNHEDHYHVFYDMCEKIYHDRVPDIWDYQWLAAMIIEWGLAIIPSVNLIQNKGFSGDGTHTNNKNDPRAQATIKEMRFPLIHPNNVHPYWKVEHDILRYGIGVRKKSFFKRVLKQIFKIPRDRVSYRKFW
jgi:hypothetical protein